jgi:hypothetical protein
MRTLIILAVIVIGLAAAGIVHFQKSGDHLDISIDGSKLKRATSEVINEGKHLVREVEEAVEDHSSQKTSKSLFPSRR